MPSRPRRPSPAAARIARGAEAHYEDGAYYDFAYRRRRQDVRFYLDLARELGGPVLELGTGTGRIALPLVQAGCHVVGVDLSQPMLAAAREKARRLPPDARARLRLRRGDMRSVRLKQRFALVIAPFNSFMHLYTLRDLERALATARIHLARRGRLAFDVLNPDLKLMLRRPGTLYRGAAFQHPTQPERYRYFESFDYDALRQVQMTSMVFQREHGADEPAVVPLSQRQFFPQELSALLHYNGWRIEHHWGDFARGDLDLASESQIIVARPR